MLPDNPIVKRAKKVVDAGMNIPLANLSEQMETNDKLDILISKEDKKPEVQKVSLEGISVVTLKGDKGDKGDSPTTDELISIIEPLIPEVKDGKDYVLTAKDKKEIAKSIEVPVVEKVVEKIVERVEVPIVTNEIKEVAVTDTPEEIADKINSLSEQIEPKTIKGLEKFFDKVKEKVNGGVRLLSGLIDVSLNSPSDGEVLTYNGTTNTWENAVGGGSITVQEIDGSPLVNNVTAIKFTNGSVTDNGDGTVNVTTGVGGGGDVSKVGTPVNNQIGVWTGDGTIEGDVNLTFDTTTDTLSTVAISASGTITGSNLSGTNTGDQNLFRTIAVSGQSDVVADSTTDTLTLVAGSNVTITTDASTDTITIASSGGGGLSDGDYGDITVGSGGTTMTIDNGVVSNTKLTNSAITIAGSSTSLGGSISQDTITGLSSTGIVKRTGANTLTIATADTDYLTPTTASSTYQPLDSDLTTIAGLSPSDDDFIQRKAGVWSNRTVAQVKTDLALKGGVQFGLYRSSGLQTGDGFKTVVPFTGTITGWVVATKDGTSQTITLNVGKATYANVPTFTDIDGSEPITLSATNKNTDTSLSTWTTSVTEGDHIEISVASVTGTVTGVYGIINITKTT